MGRNCSSDIVRRGRLTLVRFPDRDRRCNFDYSAHIEHLIRCWCERYPQLQHIDMDRIAISVVKCRSRRRGGVYATIISLKYPLGRAQAAAREHVRRLPVVMKNGREVLYLLKVFLPRFHDLSLTEKIVTILHELYHIHPKFNGEFRDLGGRRWAHGRSQKTFEMAFESLRREITGTVCAAHELFLNCRFAGLLRRFGNVYGNRYVLVPCPASGAQTVA